MTPTNLQPLTDEIAMECRAVRTRIASREITRLYDDQLRPLGLRITQLSILVAVQKMVEPLPSQIGEHLHIDRSTLSRTLERLKKNGWIVEVASEDGRNRPVKLSPEGAAIIADAYPLWKKAQQHAEAKLQEVKIKML